MNQGWWSSPRLRIAAAALVVVNGFFPAVWILFTSLKREVELVQKPITWWPHAPTLQNYVQAFTDQPLLKYLGNSLMVAGLATVCSLVVASGAAYAIARLNLKHRQLILTAIVASSMFPLAAPGVFTAGILAFVNAWDEFLLALSLNSSASMRTLPVGITLYQGEFSFPWPIISAALIVAIVPIAVLIAAFQERVVGGLTQGGLKG